MEFKAGQPAADPVAAPPVDIETEWNLKELDKMEADLSELVDIETEWNLKSL